MGTPVGLQQAGLPQVAPGVAVAPPVGLQQAPDVAVGQKQAPLILQAVRIGRQPRGASGKARIVTTYKGTHVPLATGDEPSAKDKDRTNRIPEDTALKMREAWQSAALYVQDSTARNITLNFSSSLIIYRDGNGTPHAIDIDKIPDGTSPEDQKALGEFRAMVQQIQESLKARGMVPSSDPGIDSNRPLGAANPLRKSTAAWTAENSRSLQSFVANGGLTSLKDHLRLVLPAGSPALADKAECKIRAADAFINAFRDALKEKQSKLIEECRLMNEKDRKPKQRQIALIEEQLAKLNRIDRIAVFWCVAHLPETPAGKLDFEGRSKTVQFIRQGVGRYTRERKEFLADKSFFSKSPVTDTDIANYAIEVADLVTPSKAEYAAQLAQDGWREPKGTCLEQFIVVAMQDILLETTDSRDDALSSLGMPKNPETRTLFIEALTQATQSASDVHKST